MAEQDFDGETVIERLAELPGGPALLELAQRHGEVELIGGAVRDVLLDRHARPRELDVVVTDDARVLAGELARSLCTRAGQNPQQDMQSSFHERFRTAIVSWDDGQIDIATRRSESYPSPGALPLVGAGSREQDMARRDFTVNTLAVSLAGADRGRLRGVPGAIEDLAAKRLRVLHDQSFSDDPTRLFRLARYGARLGFQAEEHTAALAAQALSSGALGSVSGARIGAELRLALGEADLPASLGELARLEILTAIHPRLRLDRELLKDALGLLPKDETEPGLLGLACLLAPLSIDAHEDRGAEARLLLDRLQFTAPERDLVLAAVLAMSDLPQRLQTLTRPSQLYRALVGIPPEGVALAGALAQGQGRSSATRWLTELRHMRLEISGAQLLSAGIPAGPEVGRRLQAALDQRLDGAIGVGAEAELKAALQA